MRFRRKASLILTIAGLFLGVGAGVAVSAYAGTGSTWCGQPQHEKCINAWGGGPVVKYYTAGGNGGPNSDFTVVFVGGSNVIIKFTGNSGWADGKHCIGDYGNDPTRSDTSLDICDVGAGNYGWGTLFTAGSSGCTFPKIWFKNNHWGGYLAPNDFNTNGSPMLLTGSKFCYIEGDPA